MYFLVYFLVLISTVSSIEGNTSSFFLVRVPLLLLSPFYFHHIQAVSNSSDICSLTSLLCPKSSSAHLSVLHSFCDLSVTIYVSAYSLEVLAFILCW